VIGPATPAVVKLVLPRAVEAGVPVFTPASVDTELGDSASGFLARMVPSPAELGRMLGELLSADGATRVALAVVEPAAPELLAGPLSEGLSAHDAALSTTVTVSDSASVTGAVTAPVEAAPDAVVLSAPDAGILTGTVIEQLAAAGFGGERLWLVGEAAGDYSGSLPAGTLAGAGGLRNGVVPDDAFTARVRAEDPGLASVRFAAEAYDATVIAALAAELSGDDGGRSLAQWIAATTRDGIACTSFGSCLDVLRIERDIAYVGVAGPVWFDTTGQPGMARSEVLTYSAENAPESTATIG